MANDPRGALSLCSSCYTGKDLRVWLTTQEGH